MDRPAVPAAPVGPAVGALTPLVAAVPRAAEVSVVRHLGAVTVPARVVLVLPVRAVAPEAVRVVPAVVLVQAEAVVVRVARVLGVAVQGFRVLGAVALGR